MRPQLAELRRADHELVAGPQPDARIARPADAGGVPVATMSPGSSVISLERWATISGIEKIRPAVVSSCMRSPLRSSAIPIPSSGPASSGRDDRRPAGRRAVEDLARHPLRRRELQVARREVVEQRVAGEVVDRVGLG